MIYSAILGHGVVGSGVAEILLNHADRVSSRMHDTLALKYILDLRDFSDLPYCDLFTKDFSVIVNDPEIRVVAEAMGGVHPAYEFAVQCLSAGKSFVTSNKELVAAKGAELLQLAREHNVNFLFEASVGGGIPILRPMAQCLVANEITEITGILNGTTNYILNKMVVDNMDFDTALRLAQENGYAERNPAADIEGNDAARKICILAALGFGRHVYPDQVKTEGIVDLTLDDVELADHLGCVIKLIGRAKKLTDGKLDVSVRPTLVPRDHILSGVHGVFNAIVVNGDQTGDVMFYGRGAGKNPTASAVVADMIDCGKHLTARKYLYWEDGAPDYVVTPDEPCVLYVYARSDRFDDLEREFDSLFPQVTQVFRNKCTGEIAFLTECAKESDLRGRAARLPAQKTKILHTLF